MVRLLVEDLPLNSSLWVYDAYHLRTIAQMEVPAVRAFRSGRTRVNQFREGIQAIRGFLAQDLEPGSGVGEAAVRLPQFLDFVAENQAHPGRQVVVIVVGGPLYGDAREPGFSMADGYYPSDGHLLAGRDQSVFGIKNRGEALSGVTVHFGCSGEPWASPLHQEKVSRFWGLYVEGQSGRMGSFTGDLATVFHAARGGPDAGRSERAEWKPEETRVEMLRATRQVDVAEWITRELPAGGSRPPAVTVGPMKIGIRWAGAIDLDLYARGGSEAETLYFEHTRSEEGYYYRDHRSSPDREYEFIEFTSPVDVWQVEAAVNFYDGETPEPPRGEVRVEFEGRIYSGTFELASRKGNRGRRGGGQDAFWARLDVPRILGLRDVASARR